MIRANVSGSAVVEYTHSESRGPISITSMTPKWNLYTGDVMRYAKRRRRESFVNIS